MYNGDMTHPLYNPATAFGNTALLKACPPEAEPKKEDEEEELETTSWSCDPTEYTLDWKCPICGRRNEDSSENEFCTDDEVQCYYCKKRFTLE
jgi:rRNA maturation protein Nop10